MYTVLVVQEIVLLVFPLQNQFQWTMYGNK